MAQAMSILGIILMHSLYFHVICNALPLDLHSPSVSHRQFSDELKNPSDHAGLDVLRTSPANADIISACNI